MKGRRWLLGSLALSAAVSSWAAWREVSCSACGAGGIPLGILGAAFYTGSLVVTAFFGVRRPVVLALLAAFGLHLGLVGLMLTRGPFCPTCLAAAGASALATASLVALDRSRVESTVAIAPWAAAAAFVLPVHPAVRDIQIPSIPGAPVQVSIYTRAGCRYCDQLRDEVLPQALDGLKGRVEVRWIDAPPAARTPGIVLSRGGRPGGRYIEGLPPAEFLRNEVTRLLEEAP